MFNGDETKLHLAIIPIVIMNDQGIMIESPYGIWHTAYGIRHMHSAAADSEDKGLGCHVMVDQPAAVIGGVEIAV